MALCGVRALSRCRWVREIDGERLRRARIEVMDLRRVAAQCEDDVVGARWIDRCADRGPADHRYFAVADQHDARACRHGSDRQLDRGAGWRACRRWIRACLRDRRSRSDGWRRHARSLGHRGGGDGRGCHVVAFVPPEPEPKPEPEHTNDRHARDDPSDRPDVPPPRREMIETLGRGVGVAELDVDDNDRRGWCGGHRSSRRLHRGWAPKGRVRAPCLLGHILDHACEWFGGARDQGWSAALRERWRRDRPPPGSGWDRWRQGAQPSVRSVGGARPRQGRCDFRDRKRERPRR